MRKLIAIFALIISVQAQANSKDYYLCQAGDVAGTLALTVLESIPVVSAFTCPFQGLASCYYDVGDEDLNFVGRAAGIFSPLVDAGFTVIDFANGKKVKDGHRNEAYVHPGQIFRATYHQTITSARDIVYGNNRCAKIKKEEMANLLEEERNQKETNRYVSSDRSETNQANAILE